MKYRVFISFSETEAKLMQTVRQHLEPLECYEVRCSDTLRPGTGFSQQIKEEIARAHLFIPIITKAANGRGWVHQEIGYAMAANVPILPLALGDALPQGMAEEIQALRLDASLADIKEKLTSGLIENQVMLDLVDDCPLYQRAEFHEDRTRMLIAAAKRVLREVPLAEVTAEKSLEAFRVRQVGALSSFSLPDEPHYSSVWRDCNGEGQPRSAALCRDLRLERRHLETLARIGGVDLIISPSIRFTERGDQAMIARLNVLIDFLENTAPDMKHFQVIVAEDTLPGNLLILGDWFIAESTTPVGDLGYWQTLGTWHAPTVRRCKEDFDRDFATRLKRFGSGVTPRDMREQALQKLRERIKVLESNGASAR